MVMVGQTLHRIGLPARVVAVMLGLKTPRNGTTQMAMAEAITHEGPLQMFAPMSPVLRLALRQEATVGAARTPTEMDGPIWVMPSSMNQLNGGIRTATAMATD
jgi:hypothetical protein